ncbi:MAG: sugar ABC transporter ATP-binding protein [Sphaerochaetaceae bacterium]
MGVLEARGITKIFPGTVALDNVNVSFASGGIHALVGKNGSGKSTLLKVISGAQKATCGELYLDGSKLEIDCTFDAFSKGIATVYQELSLIPTLTVMENILINRLPAKRGLIDWKAAQTKAEGILDSLEIDIPADEVVSNLSMWQMQMVEIAKAMSFNPKVLLLDEPTSALNKSEVENLFRIIKNLKMRDIIIIYVSHKLDELWEAADHCTVLRDGKLIGTVEMKSTSHKDLIHMMFGDVVIPKRPKVSYVSDQVVLKVEHLTRDRAFKDISFELRKGEILGIAGMLGSGRTELLRAIFGADQFDSGTIEFGGETMTSANLIKMKSLGMALTPEDRKTQGLILDASIRENLCYASLDLLASKHGLMKVEKEKHFSKKQISNLQIKISSDEEKVYNLSGGNQQKVVIGNWLNTEPSVMLFDEPSRGIDVNAKQQIFKIMWEQSKKGVSCIMVSTELEELLEVCDRILILWGGEIIGEIKDPQRRTSNEIYELCMKGKTV